LTASPTRRRRAITWQDSILEDKGSITKLLDRAVQRRDVLAREYLIKVDGLVADKAAVEAAKIRKERQRVEIYPGEIARKATRRILRGFWPVQVPSLRRRPPPAAPRCGGVRLPAGLMPIRRR
jgi:hypothetical protein